MTDIAVWFESVTKSFGTVRAVNGLDLRIRVGETVALLGANGAGKSTTVNLLLGLFPPDGGRVRVLDSAPRQAVAQGRIGAMLQEGGLMPGVTVQALLGFARERYPDPLPLAEVLDQTGLTEVADRYVDRLSGGQTQRLRFALAIVGDPELLVLDEPTAAMDVESRRAFWVNMRAYAAKGRTVLFATHYLDEADENADRIVVVAEGGVVADGTPAEIKSAAGGRSVRFTVDGSGAGDLHLLPGVTSVEVRGRTATLHTADAERTVRALFASRDRVRDIEVTGADLEDAVLALTS
ncbi:ABC transporter ATP-binding protein [Solihabitans fulvus]|uniref:ABC transporter ATP-binding protein n=1 Tax=Solihabitans fulvus TaxID=1892852 RepID=A0A5B2XIW2_9PSEU|nr:ABC transporter ATP-binding protein [Solihabitans fulvus]KAA2262702.1 ABC transporter ATP-binding protein [Solihabitans fulvus]